MSGLRVGQLAEGQANKKICSVPKTRANKDAMSPLGMPLLPWRCTSWLGEPGASGNWYRLHGQARFNDLGVMMVVEEEKTFQNLDHIFLPSSENLNSVSAFLLYPTHPLNCLPLCFTNQKSW